MSYYKNNKEKVYSQQKEYRKTPKGKLAIKRMNGNLLKKTRDVVYTHYCGSENWYCMCPKCNVVGTKFLSVDHINNDGKDHRKEIGKTSYRLYKYIIENNFPNDFQVFCMNCNWGKNINKGICPHHEMKENNDWEREL